MTEKQFNKISVWQKETFGQSTALSKITHLKEEIEELIIDVAIDGIDKRLEFADCFFLLSSDHFCSEPAIDIFRLCSSVISGFGKPNILAFIYWLGFFFPEA